jgi:hypothetical protein
MSAVLSYQSILLTFQNSNRPGKSKRPSLEYSDKEGITQPDLVWVKLRGQASGQLMGDMIGLFSLRPQTSPQTAVHPSAQA